MDFDFDPSSHKATLRGNISEETDFTPLAEKLKEGGTLDLGGIRRINSTGARQWVNFIQGASLGANVALERCSVSFVLQLNMIRNFAGKATVRSVLVPHLCPSCEHASEELVEVERLRTSGPPAPGGCPKCGTKMELDAVEEQYFAFLRGA